MKLVKYLKTTPATTVWSVKHKFVYMKNARTAGTSMYRKVIEKEMKGEVWDTKTKKEIIQRENWLNTVTDEILINDYFIFTFVRNPYDRFVSAYFHRRRPENDFANFIKNKLIDEKYGSVIDDHLYPQSWCAECDGEIYADFIGKFENINEDWKYVANKIGVSESLPNFRQKTPKADKPYHTYYDEETKKIIEKVYKRDFELFGYGELML